MVSILYEIFDAESSKDLAVKHSNPIRRIMIVMNTHGVISRERLERMKM